jgi:hypothetical protein
MLNNIIIVMEDGDTGPFLYVGKSCLFTTTYMRLYKIAAVGSGGQPSYWDANMLSPGNPFDLSEIYIRGTAGDKFTTSICVV